MKFKKIFTGFLIITLILIFNINLSADIITAPFTNTYRNPDIQTYMLDASVYSYNNVPVSQYPYDKHIRFLVMSPNLNSNGERVYRHIYMSYNEIDSQIKLYDGYIYFYVKGFIRVDRNFRQDVTSGSFSTVTGTNGSYSSTTKAVFKIAIDKSSFKFKISFTDINVNSVDDYILKDSTNSFLYYTGDDNYTFCELNSIGSLTGETYINNADIQNPRYYGITLVDKQKFIDWIIENQKYLVFSNYGISTAINYVDDIINLYEEFNSSPLKFFTSIPGFLISNGSIFSNVDKAKELYNLLDKLYQEFKISQQQKVFEVGTNNNLLPHQRVDPNTDNPIYIEDINDTLDIKLLREILKTLIQTPNIIYDLFDYYLFNISSNVSLIADYISQIPTYMTELLYYRFAPLFSDSGGFDTSELQDFLLYLFNPTYDSFDEIDLVLKDKFDLTELEQFLLLEENLNDNLLNENDTELIPLNTVGDGGEGGTQTIYPSFKFTLPISNLTKVPLELKLIDFDKFSIAITAFKGIFSVVIIFFFIRWLIRFFPKVLSGY